MNYDKMKFNKISNTRFSKKELKKSRKTERSYKHFNDCINTINESITDNCTHSGLYIQYDDDDDDDDDWLYWECAGTDIIRIPNEYLYEFSARRPKVSYDYNKLRENNYEFANELAMYVFHYERLSRLCSEYQLELDDYLTLV
jgi:hypothetical protein